MLLSGWELPREHNLGQKALQMETATLLGPFKPNRSSPWKVQAMHFHSSHSPPFRDALLQASGGPLFLEGKDLKQGG